MAWFFGVAAFLALLLRGPWSIADSCGNIQERQQNHVKYVARLAGLQQHATSMSQSRLSQKQSIRLSPGKKVGCQASIHTKVLDLRDGTQLLQIDILIKQNMIPKALLPWSH